MTLFKYFWNYYTIQLDWQQIINRGIAAKREQNNWFISNFATFGNVSFVYKLYGILSLFGFALCVIPTTLLVVYDFHFLVFTVAMLCILIALAPPIIFYVVIVWETPCFDDAFYIHKESKMHSKLLALLGVIYALLNAAFFAAQFEFKVTIIGLPAMSSVLFAMNYVSTELITQKNKKIVDDIGGVNEQNQQRKVTVCDMLKCAKTTHLFMAYLSLEYSIEALLAFIEFNQFQKFIVSQLENETQRVSDLKLVPLASNIPRSSIVYGGEENELDSKVYSAKLKAMRLYQKYIRIGTEFEINIGSRQRAKLQQTLGDEDDLMASNMNLRDLAVLFVGVKHEMKCLLARSLSRFKSQSDFALVLAHLPMHD